MSRLIVKNLPKKISEDRLRSIFEAMGQITDCCLKYTADGVFRRFAFIGYRSEAEAERAVSHFNKTYIDTSKIQVEIAKDLGDPTKPRAWSKYSQDSSAFQKKVEKDKKESASNESAKKTKVSKVDQELGELKESTEFQEFLAVHKNRSTKPLWSNDTAVNEQVIKNNKTPSKDNKDATEDVQEPTSDTDIKEQESDIGELDIPLKTEKVAHKPVPDLEYLKSKVTKSHVLSDDDSDASESDLEESHHSNDDDSSVENQKAVDTEEVWYQPKEEESRYNYIVKMKGLPINTKQSQIQDFFKPIKIKEIKIPRRIKGKKDTRVASVTFFTEKDLEQAMRRNKNFIGQKKIFLHKVKELIKVPIQKQARPWENKLKQDEETEGIEESGRLFVRNLAYCCQEEDLEELFSKYGPLTEVNLPLDSFTKRIKGFAFITYMIPEHAVKAYTDLDGTVFQGRMLHILPGKLKKESGNELTESMSYKEKKELQRKKEASKSHNWNTLFLGANAVADVMAEKYGTSKDQILSADSRQSLGVRLALGETQVVAETRDFLLEHGVALDAFSQPAAARSKTVILVKNLPANTKGEELEEIFSRYGTLGRIVMPPSGVTGIVEFAEASEARNAFSNLAYTKFKYVPLYLEWAPVGVFSSPKPENKIATSENNEEETPDKDSNQQQEETIKTGKESEGDDDQDEKTVPGSLLFVKNLNFDTTEEALLKHFQKCGKVRTASIAKKKDIKHPGKLLSMGYGFVEYAKKESADKALKRLQHSILDGHQLEIKVSHRATVQKNTSLAKKKQDPAKKQNSTKILVRNVPFEAKTEEIRELFSTFGDLKFVRLPKKLTGSGSHRGFAFVDFLTKEDAKRAFNVLCHSTHLYGRRLVLEWAETEESIDELRSKTAKHYHEEPAKKRLKKSALVDELNSANNIGD